MFHVYIQANASRVIQTLLGFNVDLIAEVISRRCLIVGVSCTLTNVLPHDITPHSVTVYRHRTDMSLCYPLIWNATFEYRTTQCNVFPIEKLYSDRPHTPVNAQYYDAVIVVVSKKLGRKWTVPAGS